MNSIVEVKDLRVAAKKGDGSVIEIVHGIDFSINKGEVLALIGESGSGKTTIALALLGYARSGCWISGGDIRVDGVNVSGLTGQQLRQYRGAKVSYVAQSAAAAFNPSKTLMEQVIEPAMIHGTLSRVDAMQRAVELFRALSLPQPETIGSRYPHQVSGGQLQRVMAAMALINEPRLVIFDEPTTALDVTTQIDVLKAFKRVIREKGITAVYVSHDLAVVAQVANQIIVLRQGEVQEHAPTREILFEPQNAYSQRLLYAAKPAVANSSYAEKMQRPSVLKAKGLIAGYGTLDAEGMPGLRIVKDVSITLPRGSSLGVIGESGSGKSTLAWVVAGMLPAAKGDIEFDGQPLPLRLQERSKEQLRQIQLVYQNADTALNPKHSVSRLLERPLQLYFKMSKSERRKRVLELLELVNLPSNIVDKKPTELSGGQKQRVNLARALAADPTVIICDEVTSALDALVAESILALLADLQEKLGISYIFISHDIATVKTLCDQVAVLYKGEQVESGPTAVLEGAPEHPYTRLLVSSVPDMEPGWLERQPERDQMLLEK